MRIENLKLPKRVDYILGAVVIAIEVAILVAVGYLASTKDVSVSMQAESFGIALGFGVLLGAQANGIGHYIKNLKVKARGTTECLKS